MQRRFFGLALLLGLSSCGDDLTVSTIQDTDGASSSFSSTGSLADPSTGEDTGDNSTGVEVGPECGNGFLEADEECDDGNRDDDDGCSKLCLEEFCGDGVRQADEACDLGSDNADTSTCTASCEKNICGDGLQGPDEGCDDGNTSDDDGCGADCTLETCGNGELEASEICDDGNRDQDDGCTTLCAPPVCGDGIVSPAEGENCDDANPDNADACPNDCTEAVCGDGVLEGAEECDEEDQNGDGVSLCSDDCTLNVCGDGYLVPEFEACDDGDATGDGTSECSPECEFNVCGDAYHHTATEGCDAGERNGYVPCSTSCAVVPAVVQIAFALNNACARYADGAVRCWGSSEGGTLGQDPPPAESFIGNDPGEMPPQPASLGGPIVDLPSGEGDFLCGLRSDGEVVCWGNGQGEFWWDDELGQQAYSGVLGPQEFQPGQHWDSSDLRLGDSPGEMPPSPIPLGGVATTHLSLGYSSACAIASDGTLRCWGQSMEWGGWPTLGYGTQILRAYPDHFPPPPVNIGVAAVDVAHSWVRTCVLGEDQFVRCFGRSEYGLLGQAGSGPLATGTSIEPPPIADLGTTVAQISQGAGGLCAVGTDGSVRCFGPHGALETVGDDPGEMPPPPLDLGPTEIAKVVTSIQLCSLSTLGEVRCWGGNPTTYGYGASNEVIGDAPGEMPPPPLDLGGAALDVFASEFSTSLCAILEDHSVVCWGRRVSGLESGPAYETIGDQPGDMPPPPLRLYE